MHIRRALLLFAIVLGLAATAASLSRPNDDDGGDRRPTGQPATTPSAAPREDVELPAEAATTVSFDATRDETRRLAAGQPATLEVSVDEPGLVEIPLLGLTATALPLTPARFEVLIAEARRYPIEFTPAAGDEQRAVGTLVVRAPEE